jgi:hypothetical protein
VPNVTGVLPAGVLKRVKTVNIGPGARENYYTKSHFHRVLPAAIAPEKVTAVINRRY